MKNIKIVLFILCLPLVWVVGIVGGMFYNLWMYAKNRIEPPQGSETEQVRESKGTNNG